MLNNMSAWQIWGLAISLIVFDFALVITYFGQPVAVGSINETDWDFRIAELRQLEAQPKSDVAGASISRESVDSHEVVSPTPTPESKSSLLENITSPSTAPEIKPWQMPFGSQFTIQ